MPKSALEVDDPEDYRMTLGEHLEELRHRLILAIAGFALALAGCFLFGQRVISAFCKPLIDTLIDYDINPQLYFTGVGDGFLTFIRISMISATVIASPWIVWQLWQFVAAGLYPRERKTITRYVPLSIGLMILGVLFVYFLVLPWTLQFFMAFTLEIPLPQGGTALVDMPATQPATLALIPGDPKTPVEGMQWINTAQGRYKMHIGGQTRVIPFGPENLAAPIITLPDYISMVFGMLLTFALSFQLPLVVMALSRSGVVDTQQLRSMRRYVYLALTVIAAIITPGDALTATVALLLPLSLLYELGIWLGRNARDSGSSPGFEVIR